MVLKAMNNLLGIEDMRRELFSYCKKTPCEECLFKFCTDFNHMDEEEIEIYYTLIFETDEIKREDKAKLIYEIQWLKEHCSNVKCCDCVFNDTVDCSCFDKEEIIHRNFNVVMEKRKELLKYCKKHSCVNCGAIDICNRSTDIEN